MKVRPNHYQKSLVQASVAPRLMVIWYGVACKRGDVYGSYGYGAVLGRWDPMFGLPSEDTVIIKEERQ